MLNVVRAVVVPQVLYCNKVVPGVYGVGGTTAYSLFRAHLYRNYPGLTVRLPISPYGPIQRGTVPIISILGASCARVSL
jgi:hypothetical protein